MRPSRQLRFKLGKRHHRYQRQGVQGHLLAVRALTQQEVVMSDHEGLDWEDIALAGALAEEMAEEEKELERMERELSKEDENDDDV
jgi:hypothetical protein